MRLTDNNIRDAIMIKFLQQAMPTAGFMDRILALLTPEQLARLKAMKDRASATQHEHELEKRGEH